jgi:hypothetical protein
VPGLGRHRTSSSTRGQPWVGHVWRMCGVRSPIARSSPRGVAPGGSTRNPACREDARPRSPDVAVGGGGVQVALHWAGRCISMPPPPSSLPPTRLCGGQACARGDSVPVGVAGGQLAERLQHNLRKGGRKGMSGVTAWSGGWGA